MIKSVKDLQTLRPIRGKRNYYELCKNRDHCSKQLVEYIFV